MHSYASIQELSAQLGLTSRTLRYWEEKGLFRCERDPQSGWRLYDEDAVRRIRLILLLRKLDIPLSDVSEVLNGGGVQSAVRVLERQIVKMDNQAAELIACRRLVARCLEALRSIQTSLRGEWYSGMEGVLAAQVTSRDEPEEEWEVTNMANNLAGWSAVRIIQLPEMRAAVCDVVSESPEDKALSTVLKWAESEGLLGTARIFGFNTTPYTPGTREYGWAACVTVPETIDIPDTLEEKYLHGGLYAAMASTNEIFDSWQRLSQLISQSDQYEMDNSRLCLEEHVPSGESPGDFHLNLLEPVRRK